MPIYKQLSDSIKNDIIGGKYIGGDKLPSIRESAAENNVSLVTMMNAYHDLEKQGLIAGGGDGYKVNSSSSVYVNEFYLKRIEQQYREILDCCKKAGIDNPLEYLQNLDRLIK